MIGQTMQIISEDLWYKLVCWRYQFTVDNERVPVKVLVNGSPKTGTTWMLRMIISLPGFRSAGNFKGDHTRYNTVKPGDVVHGHEWYSESLKQVLSDMGIKVILMVRDPRDQVVSRMFHIKRSPDHAWHERFRNMSDDEALMLCIKGSEGLPSADTMIGLYQTWLDARAAALVIKYEDLLNNPIDSLSEVMMHLGIPAGKSLVEAIVARNRFERLSAGWRIWRSRKPGQEDGSSHFRKGITGDWQNYLNEAHIQGFKEVAGQQLINLGYERDMEWGNDVASTFEMSKLG